MAEPLEIRAFQQLFISLRLPYSVRKNEQMAIVVVIYNYGKHKKEVCEKKKTLEHNVMSMFTMGNEFK